MTNKIEKKLTQEITAIRAEFKTIIEKLESSIISFNNNKDKFDGYTKLNKIRYNNGVFYDFHRTYGDILKFTVQQLKDRSVLIEYYDYDHINNIHRTYTINFDPTSDTSDLTAYYHSLDCIGSFDCEITIDEFVKALDIESTHYYKGFVECLK